MPRCDSNDENGKGNASDSEEDDEAEEECHTLRKRSECFNDGDTSNTASEVELDEIRGASNEIKVAPKKRG